MEKGARHSILVPAVVSSLLLAAACAINPATGKKQFVLIGEQQEIQIGRENDQAITAQMGLYDDAALQQYVQQLGRRLAARSERPDLEWTFRVIDDPVVNAFALPGGYIYITRGILAHLSSEAELAAVIGHEIGHVTARHSVSQMSKAQIAQLGMGLGSILAPERMQQFGGLAQNILTLGFFKFSRDDERQADDLGLRYLIDAGYDARPMAGVFDMLERVSGAAGGGRVPSWLSTHPAPENRRERISEEIAALNQDFSGRPVGTEEFLGRIDRMAFGEDPREGYFKDSLFLHPGMAFRLEFPQGWKLQNQRQAVVAVSAQDDAMVQLTLASETTAEAALQKFLSMQGVSRTGPAMGSIGGLTTAGDGFTVAVQQGTLEGRVGFVEYNDRVFQLLGYSVQPQWSAYESAIRRSLASFGRLTDRRYLDVEPQRLRVVRLEGSMSLEDFIRRYGATVPAKTLALINGLNPGDRLEAGRSYKVVTGGELP